MLLFAVVCCCMLLFVFVVAGVAGTSLGLIAREVVFFFKAVGPCFHRRETWIVRTYIVNVTCWYTTVDG